MILLSIRCPSKFLFFSVIFLMASCAAAKQAPIDYDIVYVRYPDPTSEFSDIKKKNVPIPQGEKAYILSPGADLVLLKPNGEEVVLVDCDECSVMDPFISYDGKTVYYSFMPSGKGRSTGFIYKIHLDDPEYKPIQLTFEDEFDSQLYAANTTQKHDQRSFRKIRDMAPVPLADGRLLFTSNRSALTMFNPGPNAVTGSSVQQLYTMTDHEGELDDKYKANIRRLETGSLMMVQHPMQLMDGRILFSTWQSVATKYRYAMTALFTVEADGTNLKQFTEPHDHRKFLDHFITQLSDGQVVGGYYYPSFDYGYGVLLRYPSEMRDIEYSANGVVNKVDNRVSWTSYRSFDRLGTVNITPHTTPRDIPAPNRSGKYSMPSAGKNGDLLVAYSTGYVNHFSAVCNRKGQPNLCDKLRSGIYLIPNATTNVITDPKTQLVKIKDDPNYNEIWPRAVLPYEQIYGLKRPQVKPKAQPHPSIAEGEVAGIVGTSSMYNRDGIVGERQDPFQSKSGNRELHDGNWTIQGAHAGQFTNSDIYAVRIVGTPAKPFTKPISKYGDKERWKAIKPYLRDKRLGRVVARYGSHHSERWEVLGEFPLSYKAKGIDQQGNPDTSWAAKVPAETPFLIQALDKNGMTLISELTWRALKPGEVRTDCGGCHSHAKAPLKYETTLSAKKEPITDVFGVNLNDPLAKQGVWDLSKNKIPLLTDLGVEYHDSGSLGVEFNRDVVPILNKHCVSCHTSSNAKAGLLLDDSNGRSAWLNITNPKKGKKYKTPQKSKYIRVPQARQSLLVWVAYGERLDGRTNKSRKKDIDYPIAHPKMFLSEKEKRTISRWVDLGGAIDFPQTDGMGYTDDNQLPILDATVRKTVNGELDLKVGVADVHTGIDWSSLSIVISKVRSNSTGVLSFLGAETEQNITLKPFEIDENNGVIETRTLALNAQPDESIMIKVRVKDLVGNANEWSYFGKLEGL